MQITQNNNPQWQKERPDYACIFVGRNEDIYGIWQFIWAVGAEGLPEYYLTFCDENGDEWDDIDECNFDEYLVLAKLPTEDETFKNDMESLKGRAF